ncbi:caspase family protein [Bradyrhizobium sp. KBS0727]|uniref:caspase family protein n=1 Tax=unclassified Bradyrhizobium TaxID=2631580 RepID=UPI00110D5347|nr:MULTISPECIES: caspase family protein [unclassified Bradyrhizobium]QDW39911.1 caspase family protein [Bradyrhizobium sp. KBS0725]QDW46514.1 caspase family protein [Bradyrhizobium sp. KBS0727]
MRAIAAVVFAIWSTWLFTEPAFAEKRVALVIGNSAYRNVAKLSNPANDAAAVATMFKSAGFDTVESKLNLTVGELRKALRDFGNRSRDADVAVVYYAGHGIELDGTNYLIPVDATLETDTDVLDETLPLDRVLVAIEPAKQLRLVILDACRDNPFAKNMKRTIASRAIGRGLAKVEPSSPNTMIAFAAKAGSTASDGDSKNSPFATALVNHLAKPGLDLRKAFGFVRDDVLKATNNAQEPFVYGSLGGDDVTLVPAAPVPAAAAPTDNDATMQRNYEFALQVGTKPVWDAFIEKYPSGFFTALAKAHRDKLSAEAVRIEATNNARAAQEEQTRLAIEGAKAAEQTKAAEQARATEEARVAAELAKQAQEAKVAEAERLKAAALAKAAENEAERIRAAEEKKAAAETKDAAEERAKEEKLAALAPSAEKPDHAPAADLPRSLQSELKRVGCNAGPVDGNWNTAAQHALELFNKHAGMKLDVKTANADALDAVRGKSVRVCPLICETGYRSGGDKCVKITCRSGYELNDDGTCDKIVVRKPVAKQDTPTAQPERSQQGKTREELIKQFNNSPTCSNYRASCDRSIANSHCAKTYAECMRTGRWSSQYSNFEGLAKR